MTKGLLDYIDDVETFKNKCRTVLQNKGVDVDENDTMETYLDKIEDTPLLNAQEISITQNGTYTPTDSHNGFSSVTVDINTVNNQDKTINIYQNGSTSYTPDSSYTGFGRVDVNVAISTTIIPLKGTPYIEGHWELGLGDMIMEEHKNAYGWLTMNNITPLESSENTKIMEVKIGPSFGALIYYNSTGGFYVQDVNTEGYSGVSLGSSLSNVTIYNYSNADCPMSPEVMEYSLRMNISQGSWDSYKLQLSAEPTAFYQDLNVRLYTPALESFDIGGIILNTESGMMEHTTYDFKNGSQTHSEM